jgi:hypothetical protein
VPREARDPAERTLADASPTHYVAITGTDSDDCSAPGSACRTVQYAVDQAGEGDEIRVAAGTYTDLSARPGVTWPVYMPVTQVVYISKTVTVHGGYTTTDWTTSDPGANPTTLDAQRQGRAVYITGNIVCDAELTESAGVTQTLAGVTLTLYVSDTVRQRWVEWNASLYDNQENPQVTGGYGHFSFFTPPGTYRLVAQKSWYATYTSHDLVVVEELVRHNIPLTKISVPDSLEKSVTPTGTVDYGDEITYTLAVSGDVGAEVGINDPLDDSTFLRFVQQPPGVSYADGAITGGLTLTHTRHGTVSFVARIAGGEDPDEAVTITNRACVYPAWRTRDDCIWSEVEIRASGLRKVYVPLVLRSTE